MKVTLEFNHGEEEEAKEAMNGSRLKCVIEEVGNEVFRPARKHGYPDREINDLLEGLSALAGDDYEKSPYKLISLLEAKFYGIVNGDD